MATVEEVRAAAQNVMDPELHRSLVDLGMVKDITISGDHVEVTLALTTLGCPKKQQMVSDLQAAIEAVPGVRTVDVRLAEMSREEKARAFGALGPAACPAHPSSHVARVIAVMSGKGGVGKSAVTALLAVALARRHYRVGILDADITGPSVPKMFGLRTPPTGDDEGINPVETRLGIKVMSMNLLLPGEETAVIWRGPMLSGAIKQLWENVRWGDLDYLIVDLPPGTADVPLTVLQSLPVDGVVLVSSPQELVSMVVRKALQLTAATSTPILGIVENMSYFVAPDTGVRYDVFGPSRADDMARSIRKPVLGVLPIDPHLAKTADEGRIEDYHSPAYDDLAATFLRVAKVQNK